MTAPEPAHERPQRRGRHRAPRTALWTRTRAGRTALAALAAGVPLLPASALLAPAAHADTDWDALAQCESGGDWSINTGNGYQGGLQFSPSTWRAFGGSGNAHEASREEQIRVAERVKAGQGMNAWPTCSRKTGQTSNAPNSSVPTSSGSGSGSESRSGSGSSEAKQSTGEREASSAGSSYTVRSGDTLGSIASRHGTSWQALQASNADVLSDPHMIFPGQTIQL